jgi:uncharacterized membrane protein YqjE
MAVVPAGRTGSIWGHAMSTHSKLAQWRNVGRFCASRVANYSELLAIELAETRALLVRELITLMALAVAAMFTLSFLCIAIIASFWRTPYFVAMVWGVAAVWLLLSIAAFIALRTQRPERAFRVLQAEIRSDLSSVKEVLK